MVIIGNGQNEADWGIEPVVDSADESDAAPCFAPSTTAKMKSRVDYKGLRPLRMSQYGTGRHARFFELFSVRHQLGYMELVFQLYVHVLTTIQKTVDSRLGRRENSRFLERFRYIIVASQLLNSHVNVSHYDRDGEPPFSDDEKSTIFGNSDSMIRYWVGGGFALATSFILSWIFRGNSIFTKGKAVIAVIITVVVGIFLFTRARRKWLRSLRLKAVEFAAVFVENSQTFDILASNAVTLIQEVELVSRGYRL